MKKVLSVILLSALVLSLAACSSASSQTSAPAAGAEAPKAETPEAPAAAAPAEAFDLSTAELSPAWVGRLAEAETARQLFVVAGIGETTAYVSMHEKDADGAWRQIMTTPGYIGKFGLGKTQEGDGKTPVGTFGFNYAFGIAEDPGCALPYRQVTEDDYWSGDQRDGYGYNQMVSIKDLPDLNTEDSEHLVEYVRQYQYCLNISYNADGTPGLGSAIFLHCLGPVKPYTGGCVAIPMDQMLTVMRTVREDCVVVIGSLRTLSPETWDSLKLSPVNTPQEPDFVPEVPIPEEYADELIVKTGEDGMLVTVSEKASVEAALAEGGNADGAGWLFSIDTVSEEELHAMLCSDMSGMDVFAKDAEGWYYIFYHPTDVRLVREEGGYTEEALDSWTKLNEWASSVRTSLIRDNDGLSAVTFDNSDPATALSRAAWEDGANCEMLSLEFGEHGSLSPTGVDAAPYVERLIRNAKYEYVDTEETPDGEYIVLAFPDEDARYDFFLGGDYVRRTNDDGSIEQLFKVTLADGEAPGAVMQEWAMALAKANGLT